jgi:MFS family permease
VGLTIPSLLAAGSASLPPDRFGTGSGVLNMARQVGTVLGVAGLVAILAHLDRSDPIAIYQHGLVLIIAFFAAAGVVAAILLTARTARRPARSVTPARLACPARPVSEVPAAEVAGR